MGPAKKTWNPNMESGPKTHQLQASGSNSCSKQKYSIELIPLIWARFDIFAYNEFLRNVNFSMENSHGSEVNYL